MAEHKPLLIELGTEELPPRALDELSDAFLRGVCDGLAKAGIEGAFGAAHAYASPRRLAMHIPEVAFKQGEQTVERRGPALSAALDAEGQPTRALLGFAQSCGVEVAQLEKLETDKGAWFVSRSVHAGQTLAALLPGIVESALKDLPILRPMRWGEHEHSFVRPVHWLVMLHGDAIIDGQVLGLRSGRKSRGHRFMHPQLVHVADADGWLDAMRAAKVLADPLERRERIRAEVATVAAAIDGVPRLDDPLLDELANLTEWPAAIACTFDRDFLAVPPEALVTTMVANQKFIPVFDAQGKLTEQFIGIANIDSKQPAEIRKGYERVIRPRFADARFFWDADLKTPLAQYQEQLKEVVYQQALGTLWDKSCRVAELARIIANRVGVDAGEATHAASLCKCDLMTRMVGEFPSLQGVMGRYYAAHQGESPAVAMALDNYYMPRFGGDAIAPDALGQVLSVADRLDTLAGIFAVGMKPSGSKDPFALRRAALGLARTLIEARLDIDLRAILIEALELLPDAALVAGLKPAKDGSRPALNIAERRAILLDELHAFVLERMRGYYAEQGFDNAQFESVLAVQPDSLADFDRRLRAVAAFGRLPEAMNLAAANKRVANILRKEADASGASAPRVVDPALFQADAERDLAAALTSAHADTAAALSRADYIIVLERLAQLQTPVDSFFENVMVNADDPAVRGNRLALLAQLKSQFATVADIALL
ncbi:MAG: glycine--tRNA ligase subunit beta [Rhodanobacter sp.]